MSLMMNAPILSFICASLGGSYLAAIISGKEELLELEVFDL